MENKETQKQDSGLPSRPLIYSAARYERKPFSSLEIGDVFYHRRSKYTKINSWEAEKVANDGYHYANFQNVRVKR